MGGCGGLRFFGVLSTGLKETYETGSFRLVVVNTDCRNEFWDVMLSEEEKLVVGEK